MMIVVVLFYIFLTNLYLKLTICPGVPRETQEELDFADFDLFDDPERPYSTFNFKYQHKAFDRLTQLAEFNTLLHVEDIKKVPTFVSVE